MSTVIGIFEDHYKKIKPLPVVKPGTQTRRFTHINDTVEICYKAWKKNLCDITVFQIKNLILLLRLLKCLSQNINIYLKDLVKDMYQH